MGLRRQSVSSRRPTEHTYLQSWAASAHRLRGRAAGDQQRYQRGDQKPPSHVVPQLKLASLGQRRADQVVDLHSG